MLCVVRTGVVDVIEVSALIEKIACDQGRHSRRSAVVLPQVYDEGIAIGEEVHRSNRCPGAILGLVERGDSRYPILGGK